jgi:stage II sporulation protein AA (anti-sigma F factor antagonist)
LIFFAPIGANSSEAFSAKGKVKSMKVSAKRTDRALTLYLSGELDHHAAREVMDEIDRHLDVALPLRAALDLSGVTFMDSSGIAVVLRLYKRMQNLGGSMKVVGVPKQAMRVLRAAGICQLLTVEEGEEA